MERKKNRFALEKFGERRHNEGNINSVRYHEQNKKEVFMYNYSGILYKLVAPCGIIFLGGIIILVLNSFWKKKHDDSEKKSIRNAYIILGVGVISSLLFLVDIVSPKVESYTGYFVREYRDSGVSPPLPYTYAYVFCDGSSSPKPTYHMDVFSKREIYPEDFIEGQWYTIYYVDLIDSNAIVAVEEYIPDS
ncbi:MAG: hypothetical protein IKU42_06225 [Oscillospiraceae bacterium]|nr:hypothetical protein [Oscillospiraceae bacterium]